MRVPLLLLSSTRQNHLLLLFRTHRDQCVNAFHLFQVIFQTISRTGQTNPLENKRNLPTDRPRLSEPTFRRDESYRQSLRSPAAAEQPLRYLMFPDLEGTL